MRLIQSAEYVCIGEKKLDLWIADVYAITLFCDEIPAEWRAFSEKTMTAKTYSPKEVESPLSVLLLHVSLRFTRLFRCELNEESYGEKRASLLANWSVDVCTVSRLGRFVLFSEEDSLFTFIISSGHGRSLAPVLERFHRRREELARELGLPGLEPLSFITLRFGKRANRHIIGSQNDLIHLLRRYLEDAIPPLERDQLRNVEDSLNQAPMSYLGMKSPRVALLHCHDTSRNSPTTS
jgi:hypothetical protein